MNSFRGWAACPEPQKPEAKGGDLYLVPCLEGQGLASPPPRSADAAPHPSSACTRCVSSSQQHSGGPWAWGVWCPPHAFPGRPPAHFTWARPMGEGADPRRQQGTAPDAPPRPWAAGIQQVRQGTGREGQAVCTEASGPRALLRRLGPQAPWAVCDRAAHRLAYTGPPSHGAEGHSVLALRH